MDPNAIARRLKQEVHLRDGLPEIAVGITLLLTSVLTYAQSMLPRKSIGFITAVIAFAVLLPLLSLGAPWALKRVRRQYLIGRIGYVQYNPTSRKLIAFGFILSAAMAFTLFLVVPRLPQPDRWVLAGTGLLGGVSSAWGGRCPRFVVRGVLMAATGVVVAFLGVRLEIGFTILFGSQGLLSLVSGGVVFLRFMRTPVETAE